MRDHDSIVFVYASISALMLVGLSIQTLRYRVRVDKYSSAAVERMTRVQSNVIEYVPLALILLEMLEQAGAPAAALHLIGSALVLSRFLHAIGLGYLRPRIILVCWVH